MTCRSRSLAGSWFVLAVLLNAAVSGSIQAEDPGVGTILGRVTGEGGRPLAGAVIQVEGTSLGSITGDRGEFVVTRVPAGTRTIRVGLIGFQPTTRTVNVTAGESVAATVVMEVHAHALQEIIVEGQVGQAEAYNRQRTAESVRSVVSAEQIERFPDATVPDALRRIPGVSSRPDRGETGYIHLRGLSPNLTSVTVDGTRLPTTSQSGRGVEMSSIPAEMLSSIEVIKAITPDMDADAVAGSIELGMRRPARRQFDGRFEGGTHNLSGGTTYRGGLTLGNVRGPVSYVVGGDFASQVRATENLQYAWGTFEGAQVLNRLMLQQYPIDRTRYSTNAAVNYFLGDNSNLYVRGFYSAYDTEEERHRVQYRLDAGQRQSLTDVTGGRIIRQPRQYKWERRIWNFVAGGDHQLNSGLRVDYAGSVARARRAEPYRNYFEFRQNGVDMHGDASDVHFPEVRVTNGADPNDLSRFRMQHYEWRLDDTGDRDLSLKANVQYPLMLGLGNTGMIRVGAKVFGKSKERDMSEATLNNIAGAFTMDQLGTNTEFRSITPKQYRFGPTLDWSQGEAFFAQYQGVFSGDPNEAALADHGQDYLAGERVAAGYAMTNLEFGALQLVAGARYEHTRNHYTGKLLLFDNSGVYVDSREVDSRSDYGTLFPALHLRYRLDEGTNLRFAATRTIARPGFLALAPNEFIRYDDEIVRRGNPDLQPAVSTNLDLLAERYFGTVGVVSAGLFLKDISDFTYTATSIIPAGELAGFELRQPVNGATATVYGAEFALHQNLTFLPGALSGLGFYGNYTYTESDSEVGGPGGRTVPFVDQFRHVGNVALTYDLARFTGLVSMNYLSGFLDSVGSAPENDRWGASRTQWDASFSQMVGRNLRAILQLNNITNSPYIRYTGVVNRPYESEYEGRWGSLGLRFNF
jgi:TonB-dependent receptor